MNNKLTILTAPDPRLKITAKPVAQVDDAVRQLMADMIEILYRDDAIGLAATQVGIPQRVIVVNVDWTDDFVGTPYKMANPEILWLSDEQDTRKEGCLSVPEQAIEVTRPAAARVRYLDEHNVLQEMETDGLLAKCIQHEIDHLNGKLIIDHVSKLRREMVLRKLTRMKAAEKNNIGAS